MFAPVMLFAGGTSTGILLCFAAMALLHALHQRMTTRSQTSGSASKNEADPSLQRGHTVAQWVRTLMYRSVLVLALVLAYGLYASFASAQGTLQHIDPVVFAALQLGLLFPIALAILGWTFRPATSRSVRLGLVGGIPLGLGFVCIALSLRTLGILPTAMLSALDGLMASLISWLAFRQPASLYTFLAAVCAGVGSVLFWWIAPSEWQTDLVALSCGLLFTIYAFHVERHAIVQGALHKQLLPFFGGVFCSMSVTALVLALCFGRWESVQTMTATDLEVMLYCGLATVLIPQVILTILLRQMSAVTLAFFAVLEPLISIGFASWWGEISLNMVGWCGASLILLSILVQAYASRKPPEKEHTLSGEPESEAPSSSSIPAGG